MERPLDENAYGEVTSRAAKALVELFRLRRSAEDKDNSTWAKGQEKWAKKGCCDRCCTRCFNVNGCCTQNDLIEVDSSGRGLTLDLQVSPPNEGGAQNHTKMIKFVLAPCRVGMFVCARLYFFAVVIQFLLSAWSCGVAMLLHVSSRHSRWTSVSAPAPPYPHPGWGACSWGRERVGLSASGAGFKSVPDLRSPCHSFPMQSPCHRVMSESQGVLSDLRKFCHKRVKSTDLSGVNPKAHQLLLPDRVAACILLCVERSSGPSGWVVKWLVHLISHRSSDRTHCASCQKRSESCRICGVRVSFC